MDRNGRGRRRRTCDRRNERGDHYGPEHSSFIVTLGSLTAFRSLALILSGQNPATTEGVGLFYDVTGGYIGGVFPWLVVWMAAVMLIGGAILAFTKFGYHVYATGGNRDAARNSGINVNRVKLICFVLTSGLCGLIAALIWGYLHVAAPTTGTGLEFRVIGAVIIGGAALTGGRGPSTELCSAPSLWESLRTASCCSDSRNISVTSRLASSLSWSARST